MYIYETGLIGEAIRTKIENSKNNIKGTGDDDRKFGEVLRSLMVNTDSQYKTVGMSGKSDSSSPISRTDGSSLIYAITNADTDDTAAAVVNALGLSTSDGTIKTSADSLTSAISLLHTLNNADSEVLIPKISEFVQKFNSLLTGLNTQTTTSGYLYSNILKTAASTAADTLAKAGIIVSDNGTLTFDAEKFEELGIDGFLASAASAATAVSTYASSITGSGSSILDFLTDDEDDSSNTSDYFNSLVNLY